VSDGDPEVAAAARSERLTTLVGAFAKPAPLVARANRRRTTRDALADMLRAEGATVTPIEMAPMALRVEDLGDPAKSPSFVAGTWTVQDTGAQRVGYIASPRPGQRILDACAGVGGKSTHLAELVDDTASIVAADQSSTKLELLAQTAERLGLSSIRSQVCDLLDPAAPLGDTYDLIVLDAPCTGLGVLRRHPDAKWRLTPADVPRLAALQARLLDAVVPRLAPGGKLIYSVCTFTRAEGPAQIASLVARTNLTLDLEQRTWPPDADAFYIARLSAP
jgi:16S rRNA (cytosine967-C5)-methyltransferase